MSNDDIDICLSGGANGSDILWGYCANLNGHEVIHWCDKTFKTKAPKENVYRLDQETLKLADYSLKKANKILKRKLNFKSSYINLLRRNYYQVLFSKSVYAISTLDKNNIVQGGTAWAIQMFIDRYDDNNVDNPGLYLYERNYKKWMSYDFKEKKWSFIERPPFPSGTWTGIGTRTLDQQDINKIKSFMNLF